MPSPTSGCAGRERQHEHQRQSERDQGDASATGADWRRAIPSARTGVNPIQGARVDLGPGHRPRSIMARRSRCSISRICRRLCIAIQMTASSRQEHQGTDDYDGDLMRPR